MPKRAWHECAYPGCHRLTKDRYCAVHAAKQDTRRESSYRRGYTSRWAKARRAFLMEHPVCECPECQASGQPLPADVVDHIIPHRGDPVLFWDRNNWQAMNHVCHNKKTAREDGGFGNKKR